MPNENMIMVTKLHLSNHLHNSNEAKWVGARISIPKMSIPKMSIPKKSIHTMFTVPKCPLPLCVLCQNVYSKNVYYLKKKLIKNGKNGRKN